ncbi:MAG: GH3 auxin-responsive promoter family protein [Opitutae bacterium]|nr:GH3 auxin-responsive promoter family protein [Opitutae bacterium]
MSASFAPPPVSLSGKLAGVIGRRLAARTAHRLALQGDGSAAQAATLARLVRTLAPTAFGRDHGLEPGMPYEHFRARVAPRNYEGFSAYIERMKRGEADVLHPGRCTHFAVSSGTTAGPSKWLPVNTAMLAHFRDAGLDSLFFHALRAGRGSVFRGRHLFLGGSTGLVPVPGVTPPIYSGDLSGITALNLPWWAERQLYEPGREIARLENWPEKVRAIAERTWNRDLTLVGGIPSWLLVLADAVRDTAQRHTGRRPESLAEIWPNLECLVHGGVPVDPFTEELRRAFGPAVRRHEVYPASEGFIAAQDTESSGLRLMADHGIFYEFVPFADYDESDAVRTAARAVPLAGVRLGVDYVMLLTTPAGLVRYVIGDLVRFVSVEPPRLVYVGRTKLQLSAFGEHVIEKEITDALTTVCRGHGVQVENFHVAPLFPGAARAVGRHEWWIEFRGAAPAPTEMERFRAALDRELAALNDDYAAKRAGRGLELPLVRVVPSGGFERWLKHAGKWGGQHKTPRCRSDRRIADALAALFAAE